MSFKKCSKCGKKYPATSNYFHKNNRVKSGLISQCKNCKNEYRKKYYKTTNNSEWKVQLKYRYGLTADNYDLMYNKQQGRCGICKTHQKDLNQRLSVDHDHKTGRIRGLLCNSCNRGLGMFNEDASILEIAAKYLKHDEYIQ